MVFSLVSASIDPALTPALRLWGTRMTKSVTTLPPSLSHTLSAGSPSAHYLMSQLSCFSSSCCGNGIDEVPDFLDH